MALLELRKVSKRFGGLSALSDIDLNVHEGEIVGLIGPNGAGKSTLFNVVNGFQRPSAGAVLFTEREITGLKPDTIARIGIGRAFQASTLFMRLTAFQNVFNGFHLYYRQPVWKSFLHTPGAVKEEKRVRDKALEILTFMGLAASKDVLAQNLPYGHQKILGVCIALATEPRLLLLDEPFTGMHPEETSVMVHLIGRLREKGLTILVVEHNMDAIMRLCDRIAVLNQGRKIAEGLPDEITSNREVIDAYLGTEEDG